MAVLAVLVLMELMQQEAVGLLEAMELLVLLLAAAAVVAVAVLIAHHVALTHQQVADQERQVAQAPFGYFTNMWAVLDYDDKTVIGIVPPDKTIQDFKEEINGRTTVKMTLENSPAFLLGTYENGKFYQKGEKI
jgi:uncharacterized membrane protein